MKKILISIIIFLLISACGDKKESENQAHKNDLKKSTKIFKLAILDSQDKEPYKSARLKMIETLEKNGYKNGENLEIYYTSIGNDKEIGLQRLTEMAAKKPDVIFTNGTVMTIVAKESKFFNNPKYKFVFACVTDPVGVGVIEKFGTPPTFNYTGVSYPVPVDSRLKFIKDIIPKLKSIALIYADMPQSHSYVKWVKDALKMDDFKRIKVYFEKVDLVKGEDGAQKMADNSVKLIKKLNKKVDVFMSPNDQMGVQEPFAGTVWKNASKPLIGLGKRDVMEKWGATASIYPSHESMGFQAGHMIMKLFKGTNINSIPAEWPRNNGFALDLTKAEKFGLKIPVKIIEMAGSNIIK